VKNSRESRASARGPATAKTLVEENAFYFEERNSRAIYRNDSLHVMLVELAMTLMLSDGPLLEGNYVEMFPLETHKPNVRAEKCSSFPMCFQPFPSPLSISDIDFCSIFRLLSFFLFILITLQIKASSHYFAPESLRLGMERIDC